MQKDDLSDLKPQDIVVAYHLVEQLCEIGSDARAWRNHFLIELQRIFDGGAVISYLTKFSLDPGDIAPKTLMYVEVGTNSVWRDYLGKGDLSKDPMTPFIMERFGTDFTCAGYDWMDIDAWHATEFYKTVAKPSDWDSCIYSQVGIIRPGVVDGLGVTRRVGRPSFTRRDVALLRFIHQELARLWRKHDPLDIHMLPPRQREVLEGIRRGESRKTIADKMTVSDHTIHGYEKALFDRAKVTSRTELQAVINKLVRPALLV